MLKTHFCGMQLLWKKWAIERNLKEEETIKYIMSMCKTAYPNTMKFSPEQKFSTFLSQ